MRIALGSDHAGYDLKGHLALTLQEWGHEIVDLGTDNGTDSVDYPDFGAAVGQRVAAGDADAGILVCGTGIGMAIAANKVPGIRAATVHDVTSARLAREHNHANVLCLGSRVLGPVVAEDAVRAWLEAVPGTGRHLQRIEKIAELDTLLVDHER
jgi:RpiB/LacA/LacB family sugar-phosphate isomerase